MLIPIFNSVCRYVKESSICLIVLLKNTNK